MIKGKYMTIFLQAAATPTLETKTARHSSSFWEMQDATFSEETTFAERHALYAHKLCQLKLDVTYISFTTIIEDCLRDFVIRSKCYIATQKSFVHLFSIYFLCPWDTVFFLLPD
jgi:hypothetical protein